MEKKSIFDLIKEQKIIELNLFLKILTVLDIPSQKNKKGIDCIVGKRQYFERGKAHTFFPMHLTEEEKILVSEIIKKYPKLSLPLSMLVCESINLDFFEKTNQFLTFFNDADLNKDMHIRNETFVKKFDELKEEFQREKITLIKEDRIKVFPNRELRLREKQKYQFSYGASLLSGSYKVVDGVYYVPSAVAIKYMEERGIARVDPIDEKTLEDFVDGLFQMLPQPDPYFDIPAEFFEEDSLEDSHGGISQVQSFQAAKKFLSLEEMKQKIDVVKSRLEKTKEILEDAAIVDQAFKDDDDYIQQEGDKYIIEGVEFDRILKVKTGGKRTKENDIDLAGRCGITDLARVYGEILHRLKPQEKANKSLKPDTIKSRQQFSEIKDPKEPIPYQFPRADEKKHYSVIEFLRFMRNIDGFIDKKNIAKEKSIKAKQIVYKKPRGGDRSKNNEEKNKKDES